MLPAAPRRKRILALALPIIGGMISQNLLNLVDTAFVSRLGNEALGAVGLGSFANFMSMSFVTGLATGVQAVAARRKGEGAFDTMAIPLNGGLLLALFFGIPIAFAVHFATPFFFPALADHDESISALGATYLQIRLIAVPALGCNFAFRGYFNAIDLSRLYLRTIVVMHLVNVFLDFALIFGQFGFPEMGVAGAATASTIATYVGLAYYILQAWSRARPAGFMRALPSTDTMRTMLNISLPSALQNFFFATGMTLFFAMIARLGTSELAAANVLTNLLLVALLPGIGFGLAATSLVGQALGEKNVPEARRWGWDVVRTGVPVIACIASAGLFIPDTILIVFLEDPSTRALAIVPLRIIALTLPLDTIGMVLLNALLGAGASRQAMVVATGLQWLVFLPAIYLVAPVLQLGLVAVYLVNASYRLLQSATFSVIWRGNSWTKINL